MTPNHALAEDSMVSPDQRRLLLVAWRCAAIILVASLEIKALAHGFYSLGLAALDHDWEWMVPTPALVAKLGLSICFAAIVFSGPNLRATCHEMAARLERVKWPWLLVLGNLVAFATFSWLSTIIFNGEFYSLV